MRRLFLVVVLVGLALLAVLMLVLGAFPPEPHQQEIQRVLPNDRFEHKGG
jgi:hypothetical protein